MKKIKLNKIVPPDRQSHYIKRRQYQIALGNEFIAYFNYSTDLAFDFNILIQEV